MYRYRNDIYIYIPYQTAYVALVLLIWRLMQRTTRIVRVLIKRRVGIVRGQIKRRLRRTANQ
jgi:hypothetical protein